MITAGRWKAYAPLNILSASIALAITGSISCTRRTWKIGKGDNQMKKGRPAEVYRFQDNDSIIGIQISRCARGRGEIGHIPDRSTPQADRLSALIREFVLSAERKYHWPAPTLPPIPTEDESHAIDS
jgi:hypothetical protein